MPDPILYLEKKGFNLQYPTRAIDVLNNRCSNWNIDQFFTEIHILTDIVPNDMMKELDIIQVKYTYFYVVQTLLITNKQKQVADPEWLLQHSMEKSITFCTQHRTALYDEQYSSSFSDKQTTSKKQNKGDHAYELFCSNMTVDNINNDDTRKTITDLIRVKLDMSDSGSRTYFHSCKKRYKTQHNIK